MAKRRRLETPSSADLSRIEEQFRSETSLPSLGRGIAPIAQVAAESAAVASPESAAARAARAKAEADAARLQEAETRGLLIAELPIDQIDEIEEEGGAGHLAKSLGLWQLTAIGVGGIIGVGIFSLAGWWRTATRTTPVSDPPSCSPF